MEKWESIEAIRRIILEYPFAADQGDLEAVGRLYEGTKVRVFDSFGVEHDAGWPSGGSAGDIARHYGEVVRFYDNGTPNAQHLITNIDVRLDESGQTASARSYFTVIQATESLPLQVVIAGRYEDRFALKKGEWRLTDRDEYLNLMGDLSQHITSNPVD